MTEISNEFVCEYEDSTSFEVHASNDKDVCFDITLNDTNDEIYLSRKDTKRLVKLLQQKLEGML